MSTDVAELMSRDPLALSEQDLDVIIITLRQARAQYHLTGDKQAGNPKRTTKVPKTSSGAVDLVALGLIAPPGEKKET